MEICSAQAAQKRNSRKNWYKEVKHHAYPKDSLNLLPEGQSITRKSTCTNSHNQFNVRDSLHLNKLAIPTSLSGLSEQRPKPRSTQSSTSSWLPAALSSSFSTTTEALVEPVSRDPAHANTSLRFKTRREKRSLNDSEWQSTSNVRTGDVVKFTIAILSLGSLCLRNCFQCAVVSGGSSIAIEQSRTYQQSEAAERRSPRRVLRKTDILDRPTVLAMASP